jgi:hypothetical protein
MLIDGKTGLVPGLVAGLQGWKCPGTLPQTWYEAQMTQIYSNPLKFFVSPCPEYPCHSVYFPVFYHKLSKGKILPFRKVRFQTVRGQGTWGWKRPSHLTQINRPVKDLVYKDLLTTTFTQARCDRGIKTWCVSVSYPQCVF